MTRPNSSRMLHATLRVHCAAWIAAGVITSLLPTAAHATCNDVRTLLLQGYAVDEIARGLGVSVNQVTACATGARSMRSSRHRPDAVGPAPFGAAGPAPLGAAGPPPLGAAGPPPLGAAGPAPFGAAGPPPLGAAGPPPLGSAGSQRR